MAMLITIRHDLELSDIYFKINPLLIMLPIFVLSISVFILVKLIKKSKVRKNE